MNNSMVAHLWAHEQEESASGSNFFFEGTSFQLKLKIGI